MSFLDVEANEDDDSDGEYERSARKGKSSELQKYRPEDLQRRNRGMGEALSKIEQFAVQD